MPSILIIVTEDFVLTLRPTRALRETPFGSPHLIKEIRRGALLACPDESGLVRVRLRVFS
jgi:hypothetical protein